MEIFIQQFSSLEKLLNGKSPDFSPLTHLTVMQGESISWQIACKCSDYLCLATLKIEGDMEAFAHIRHVNHVPVSKIKDISDWQDKAAIVSDQSGIYPDLLTEFSPTQILVAETWKTFWITLEIPTDALSGKHQLSITCTPIDPSIAPVQSFIEINVIPMKLPKQTLKCLHWFHSDCLMQYYDFPAFSDEYWRVVSNFLIWTRKHGINSVLTPIFTPPLDTEINLERPTVQLIDIYCTDENLYQFDFSKLRQWVTLAKNIGFEYFEFPHFFTQWGANATPKIIATMPDGSTQKIFGWNVTSDSPKYADFLRQFIPQLLDELKRLDILEHAFFHCSDEPTLQHMEKYAPAMQLLKSLLPNCYIVDAMSHTDFVSQGIIQHPIPCEDVFHDFDNFGLQDRWIYYCCGPHGNYPNRFIFLESIHNRILGALLYKFNCSGFLHWAVNFYNTFHSLYPINPFLDNSAEGIYPPGDAFIVYPGKNGIPMSSIRAEIFAEALQDQRELQAMESILGREYIINRLDKISPNGCLDFNSFTHDPNVFLDAREKLLNETAAKLKF